MTTIAEYKSFPGMILYFIYCNALVVVSVAAKFEDSGQFSDSGLLLLLDQCIIELLSLLIKLNYKFTFELRKAK